MPTRHELIARAKWMRANSTPAEKRLWSMLRDKRLEGFKFRRQVVLDWYIADFVSFERRVIVEADGSQHAESEHDRRRDAHLKSQGFQVLRYWNNEVLENPDGVWHSICDTLQTSPLPLRERVPEGRVRGRVASAAQETSSGSQTRAAPHTSAASRLPPSPARGEGL